MMQLLTTMIHLSIILKKWKSFHLSRIHSKTFRTIFSNMMIWNMCVKIQLKMKPLYVINLNVLPRKIRLRHSIKSEKSNHFQGVDSTERSDKRGSAISLKGTVLTVSLSVMWRTTSTLTSSISMWKMSSGTNNSKVLNSSLSSRKRVKIHNNWVTLPESSMNQTLMEANSWPERRESGSAITPVQPIKASQETRQKRILVESSAHHQMVSLIRTCFSNSKPIFSRSHPTPLKKMHSALSMTCSINLLSRKLSSIVSSILCRQQRVSWEPTAKIQRDSSFVSHLTWWKTS